MLRDHVQLERLERSLRSASTVGQCWGAVESCASSLGYSEVNARLAGISYTTISLAPRTGPYWQMRLNLPEAITSTSRSATGPPRTPSF